MPTRTHAPGFTLVELLVVIAVLAVLAVLLWPIMPRHGREKAKQAQCINNQKQITIALLMYAQDRGDKILTLPATDDAWSSVLTAYCESKVYDCPTKTGTGADHAPEYGFNSALSGVALKQIEQPSCTPVTADLDILSAPRATTAPKNYAVEDWDADIDVRHASKVIMGFVDGHVEMINFTGLEDNMLLTLYQRGFNPYDGAGTVILRPKPGKTSSARAWTLARPLRGNVRLTAEVQGEHGAELALGGIRLSLAPGTPSGELVIDAGATRCTLPLAVAPTSWLRIEALYTRHRLYTRLSQLPDHAILAVTAVDLPVAPTTTQFRLQPGNGRTKPGPMSYRNIAVSTW